MIHINQNMTSDVWATSAITITLLFLQRHKMESGEIATDNPEFALNNNMSYLWNAATTQELHLLAHKHMTNEVAS